MNNEGSNENFQSCAEEALALIHQRKFLDAEQLLLKGLSADPFNPRARILLAKVFFELGYVPFAVRELEQVYLELPDNKYVKNLLEKLAPERVTVGAPVAKGPSDTLAEADFDIGDIEILEKE